MLNRVVTALGIMALMCSPAMAGRNANGAMLLHADNSIVFSMGTDYCSVGSLPATCDGINTVITKDPADDTMIWMVASFIPGSSPGVNAYQVGLAGDVTSPYFDGSAVCGPGALEIPDAGWPGAGAGDAVAYTATVNSLMFKMYWFACGAPGTGSTLSTTNYYGADHHAEWADDSNPPVIDFCNLFGAVQWGGPGHKECPCCPVGACCFPDGSCQVLSSVGCASANGAYQGDNTVCDPNNCPPPLGACCFNGAPCQDLTSDECAAAGGVWEGMGTSCATFQCPPPVAACCFADCTCQNLMQEQCAAQGGVWEGYGTSCEIFDCGCPPPIGACCIGGVCSIRTQDDCIASGGQYQGDGTTCEPNNPCPPVPTKPTTWGQIKGLYR